MRTTKRTLQGPSNSLAPQMPPEKHVLQIWSINVYQLHSNYKSMPFRLSMIYAITCHSPHPYIISLILSILKGMSDSIILHDARPRASTWRLCAEGWSRDSIRIPFSAPGESNRGGIDWWIRSKEFKTFLRWCQSLHPGRSVRKVKVKVNLW